MTDRRLTLEDCADAAGSFNNPELPGGGILPTPPGIYVPPELCVGDWDLSRPGEPDDTFEEGLAAENLQISGARVNVFKLLGIHEQGKLVDLTGLGIALGTNNPQNAFDALAAPWTSLETGMGVLTTPSFLGYDFGIVKTTFGQPENAPGAPNSQHITSIQITQSPTSTSRALQIRVDRADGKFCVDVTKIQFTGVGNGGIGQYTPGVDAKPGFFMIIADSPTQFMVAFTSSTGTEILGNANVGVRYNSLLGSFNIIAGTTPFSVGDTFTVPVELDWKRVDVVNLPNVGTSARVRIKQSAASRYWRIVPTMFAGVVTNEPWIVDKVEMFDWQDTRLDDIQDMLFMENRDRDYAKVSLQLRAAYSPFDAVSDLAKFGFQIPDIYSFTTSFAFMVRTLGRPIVVGDVLEIPSELQWDHNLRPVRKFLEVTDTSWAADSRTSSWRPIIYRFQAQQLIPGQEHRDLLGTVDTQKYVIDDGRFFEGIEQIQTAPLTVTEANNAEAIEAVPEKGTNVREAASGTNRFNAPGSYDGVGLYVEDGLPPDGQPYTEGFKLPDVADSTDNQFFRLLYDPRLNIAARLYRFSGIKNKWTYIETDRRGERNVHRPSQQAIFDSTQVLPLSSKTIS